MLTSEKEAKGENLLNRNKKIIAIINSTTKEHIDFFSIPHNRIENSWRCNSICFDVEAGPAAEFSNLLTIQPVDRLDPFLLFCFFCFGLHCIVRG
ncbi:hypothetical protein BGX38DRAFT_187802 [Terfezia claveryi]|nr:hypothetical protein BGX38DRAFT_187802 [Terfezia claveryi]